MLRIFHILLPLTILFLSEARGQPKIKKEISYISDLAFNLSGGYKTGATWLGCLQASLSFNTYDLNLWKNGSFKFSYISTHGKPFSHYTGDLQIISNIEAGHLATTFELWYKHQFGKLALTAGFIDLNAYFSFNDQALSLINSSFGIQPTISGNMPVPIFPVTALGSMINFTINAQNKIQFGVFDGIPGLYGDYHLLPEIHWDNHEGLMIISEFSHQYNFKEQAGILKVGAWLHTLNVPSLLEGEHTVNPGFYLIAEQEIFKHNSKKLHFWAKFGGAPKDCNLIRYFTEAGISFTNFMGHNENDVIVLGIGQALFCKEYHKRQSLSTNETVIEFSVRKQLGIISIQPDFQYVINPSGLPEIKNPLCLLLRTSIAI